MQEHHESLTEPALSSGRPRPSLPPCLQSWFYVGGDEGKAHVFIGNDIGTFNATAADLVAAIGGAQEVEFDITSTGGDSETAFQVNKALAGKVSQATIVSDCSSAAWIFALTAKRILMATDAHVLIHGVITAVVGSADALEMAARNLREDDRRVRDLFATRAKLPSADLEALFDGKDHELTPDECLRFGFVDELFTPRAPTAKDADAPSAATTQAKAETETEDERLFMDMAKAFGTLPVRDLKKFQRRLWDWAIKNVREET